MKVAVVLGTSKTDGNTRYLVNKFVEMTNAPVFDLADYQLSYYDYLHENRSDDFIPLIRMLTTYDHIVFASPVYWYSMSAQLKVFFDRLSDLLTIEKPLGRQLKGKEISVISTGYNHELPDCFIEPFKLTARYMQLEFRGFAYLPVSEEGDLGRARAIAEWFSESICREPSKV
ncbi:MULTISPECIES: flavodoxin family protein [Vibrio]|uniref:flavodoxin family protein n=1 Tax=Vibrio TaxID=662 RepID=UPI002075FE8F|nr:MULTISPECIES: NAD(P)H-dependent oxidoreductase [Vibrio]USD31310.1 NAD(P)H-dependent oxidoreductase [Vibrio sp. SCSIO 43186]USD44355.1 NAD(P)H-dependent oxidoreductase [Vibrio sp. SCSIO 43145]USD68433.1 NAD(P)H-dependent oxidoreductase [Vibrio sp. SCSIO 43139]USD96119.1 FMN reductase [Vibrio coralliilyticus]